MMRFWIIPIVGLFLVSACDNQLVTPPSNPTISTPLTPVPSIAIKTTYRVPSDFTRIQDCLNVVRPGDTCLISAGTYNEALVLTRNGTSNAPIFLKADGIVTINSGNERTLVTLGNVHDWVIDGFRFLSTHVDTSHPSNIGTVNFGYNYWGDGDQGESGNDRFILRNCYIEGSVYFYGSDNLVENCELNGLGRFSQGLIEAYQPSENNVFRNNNIHDYTERGGWTLQLTHNTLWEGNTIYNTSLMGIDCDGAGNPVYACNLINNIIYNIDGLGVELENCFDCTMRGNQITNTDSALSVINYGADIAGVEYRDDPIGGVIESNVFNGAQTAGVICRGASSGTFRNNTIKNTTQPSGYWAAIALVEYGGYFCQDWTITNNELSQNRYEWFVHYPPNGIRLTANENRYDSDFSVQWYQRNPDGFQALNFDQWQAMGYDAQEMPTP